MKKPSEAEWYKNWFDETYLLLYQNRDSNEARLSLDWLSSQLPFDKAHVRCIDLACGAGRHTKIMTEKYRWNVTGIDYSAPLLELAKHKSDTQIFPHLNYVRGDIRCLPFKTQSFNLATSFFTSFGYFQNDNEHRETLLEFFRVLHIGGILVLDLMNPDDVLSTLVPEDVRKINNLHILQQRRYIPSSSRIEKTITIKHASGTTRKITESVRLFRLEEIRTLLETSGFDLRTIVGDYYNAPFKTTSPRLIIMTEKTHG